MNEKEGSNKSKKLVLWVKKLGFVGFMFFLIKGLLWLIIPLLIAYFAW